MEDTAKLIICAVGLGTAVLLGAFGIGWIFVAATLAPAIAGMDWPRSVLFRMYGPPNHVAAVPTFFLIVGLLGFASYPISYAIGLLVRRRKREWPDWPSYEPEPLRTAEGRTV
jgi:hypothetical protein